MPTPTRVAAIIPAKSEAERIAATVAAVRPHVWELATEVRVVRQQMSDVYDSIRPFRSVYLAALFRRLPITCCSRAGSP